MSSSVSSSSASSADGIKLVVLRAGDAAAPVAERRGQFFSWIVREASSFTSPVPLSFEEHDVRIMDVPLPTVESAHAFIITGSSSSVTERAPWMLRTEEFIRALHQANVPLFGICFGHQMIAEALGGKVAKNPAGREIGTITIHADETSDDPLLTGLPSVFTANATHVDTVITLPPGANAFAKTNLEPHAMYAVGETTKCVQFHPEIDGDAMRGYIDARAHLISAEGLDVEVLRSHAVDAPTGAETLRNFVRLVIEHAGT